MNEPQRLSSLDALRGFDMFWIIGGTHMVREFAEYPGGPFLRWAAGQTHHATWHGFTLYDLIFPLFLFLAGVSMPLSFAARRAAGRTNKQLALHALRRGSLLVLLGMVYNGLLSLDFDRLRWASVLGRIGLAWMFAAWIAIAFERAKTLVIVSVSILVGYWLLMTVVPVPGGDGSSLVRGKNMADWFDQRFLPGRLHRSTGDPEGLLSTVPAIATCLAGVLTGKWLSTENSGNRKAAILALAGAAGIGLGMAWDLAFPINKNLWTSSFVLVTAGASCLLLSAFYWIIDVRGWKCWSKPFIAFGANAIAVYLLGSFVDWEQLADITFGHLVDDRLHPGLMAGTVIILQWLLFAELYRRRVFLKV